MTSASYTVRTAESHEYADALEVLIAAFDGDPAMMAALQVVAADRNLPSSAQS